MREKLEFYNINDAWITIANKLFLDGRDISNTKEINNVSFVLKDINNNVLTARENFSLHYYLGEMIWYAAGDNSTKFISQFGKIWEKLSDDGITNNSAYGHIIKYANQFNQLEKIIELLKNDPDSRRAVININSANVNVIETKDEPCTIALQFFVRDNKVHATGIMRSNDIWTGTPYDIFYFTELQKYIAKELGYEYGTYTHFVTSMHMYERNFNQVNKSIDEYELNGTAIDVKIDGVKIMEMAPFLHQAISSYIASVSSSPKSVKDFTEKLCIAFDIVEGKYNEN